jgi:hypothetical protein
MSTTMALRHLAREAKTSLELAIAASAPSELVDRLAIAVGLLEAILDMALADAGPVIWVTRTIARAEEAVLAWRAWRAEHPATATA